MADAGLQIEIGANVKDAADGIDSVRKKLAALYAQLDEAKSRQANLIDPSNIKAAGVQIGAITKQIDALENNQGFSNLAVSAKGTLGPLNDAYGAVRKLAQVLPGIGIAGIFGLAFEGLTAAIEAFSESSNKAEQNLQLLNKTLGEGGAKAAGEVTELQDLVAIAEDTANATSLRAAALRDLQQQYPGYFANLSIEKSSYAEISGALDKVTAALTRQAQIKGLEGAISEAYKKIAETVSGTGTTFENITATIAGLQAAVGKGIFNTDFFKNADRAKSVYQNLFKAETVSNTKDQVAKLNDALKDLLKTSLEQNDAALKTKPTKAIAAADPDTLAATQRALEEIDRLNKALNKVDTRSIFDRLADAVDPNQTNALSNKIALVIRNNARDGIDKAITATEVSLLAKQIAKLQNPQLLSSVNTTVTIRSNISDAVAKYYSDTGRQLTERMKDLPPLKSDIKINPNFLFTNFGESVKKYADRIKSITDAANQDISNLIIGSLEALGKSLAGGGNPFSAILSLIGDAVEEFGKQLIIIAGIAVLAKDALATVFANPATAIVVGALAIAAGAAIKQLGAKKGVTAFSQGGVVTGPTMGLIGEAGPEAIIPLSKFDQILNQSGGNGGVTSVNITGQLQGNNIRLALARTNKLQALV
jgi:hypothetical protein